MAKNAESLAYLDNACESIWFSLCMINNTICWVCNDCSNRILLIKSLNVFFNLCFISFHLPCPLKPSGNPVIGGQVWQCTAIWKSADLKKNIFFLFVSENKIEFDFFHFLWFTSRLNLGCLRSSDWSIRLDFSWSKVGDESKTHSTSHSPKLLIIITHYLLMFPWSQYGFCLPGTILVLFQSRSKFKDLTQSAKVVIVLLNQGLPDRMKSKGPLLRMQ